MLDDKAVTPDMVSSVAQTLLAPHNGTLLNVYEGALNGFSASNLDDTKALAMAKDPRVVAIGQDGTVQVDSIQAGATWGLDRIDSKTLTLNGQYEYVATGQNVHAYIIDTGIRATHADFGGRVKPGFTAINDGNGTNDCQGHGTHVAATVGGTQYGVAKNVSLYPVRTMDCQGSGSMSNIFAGVDWVIRNHQKPAVVNMSLGTGAFSFFDNVVQRAIDAGIVVVAAAGNSNIDTCTVSPARLPAAITVGATDKTDKRASFSNWGTCVDVFAPGKDIVSATFAANTGSSTKSGTSMAAPHVAGVVALYLEQNPMADPAAASTALLGGTTGSVVTDVKGAPNKLIYSLFAKPPVPTPATSFKDNKIWTDQVTDVNGWNVEMRYLSIQYADVNGDKRDDMCGYAADGVRCTLSDGTGAFGAFPVWDAGFSGALGWDPVQFWSTIRFPDVNGDGKADVCGHGGSGIICAVSTGTSFTMGGTWTTSFKGGVWDTAENHYATIQFADVNGDGKADVCGRDVSGIVCSLSTGTSFGAATLWDNGFGDSTTWTQPEHWKTISFPDVNGDGKADVCGRGALGIYCALSNGSAFQNNGIFIWTSEFQNNGVWESDPKYYTTIQFADLDGDGKDDICGRGTVGVNCAISNGTKFNPQAEWTKAFSDTEGYGTQESYWSTLRLADVTGDGKADICARSGAGIVCGVSTGTSFVDILLWDSTYSDALNWNLGAQNWATIRFPDLNGDGRADVCGRHRLGLKCALALP